MSALCWLNEEDFQCSRPAVMLCADCGHALCSIHLEACCGEPFCEGCADWHREHGHRRAS